MRHYAHHIGDYRTRTAHLSLLEDGAYRRLLDLYYMHERPLPTDIAAIQRLCVARFDDERAAVETVLREFFSLQDDGWHNTRADKEIATYQARAQSGRENGPKGGRKPKRNRKLTGGEPETNREGTVTVNQEPRTDNQEPNEEERAFDEFVEAARKNGWPTPRAMDAGRRKKLRIRLQEHGLDGWRGMLSRAERSTFLRTKFALKFDWILEPSNFTKVIEGNYDDKGSAAVTTTTQPTADDWRGRVKWHREKGMWNPNWGPEPGKPGCFVPRELLQ